VNEREAKKSIYGCRTGVARLGGLDLEYQQHATMANMYMEPKLGDSQDAAQAGWHHYRLMILLTGLTTLLFQTHWIDDLGTDERDVLGITVSAIGSLLLLSGLLLLGRPGGRPAVLVLGFLFTAFVSAADLCGLDAQGSLAPDVVAHWRDNLGWSVTLAVALTLVLSAAALLALTTWIRRPSPSNRGGFGDKA
jgi:hypothetical protein